MTSLAPHPPLIDLATGQVPEPLTERVTNAIAHACTQPEAAMYEAVPGDQRLRDAIAGDYASRGIAVDPSEVVVVPGARSGLVAMLSAVGRDADVLVPGPYWSHLPGIVEAAGARMSLVRCGPDSSWKVTPRHLDEVASASDARALVLTTPVNPTGAAYRPGEVAEIRHWARERGVFLLLDDTYWAYAAEDAVTGISPDEGVGIVGGLSKVASLAGLRIGWCCAPSALAGTVAHLVDLVVGPTSTLSQAAGLASLSGEAQHEIRERAARIATRRAATADLFRRVPLIRVLEPEGGIYLCLDATSLLGSATADDVELARAIRDHTGVSLRPGSTFGMPGYLRLCVAGSMDELAEAASRLAAYAAETTAGTR